MTKITTLIGVLAGFAICSCNQNIGSDKIMGKWKLTKEELRCNQPYKDSSDAQGYSEMISSGADTNKLNIEKDLANKQCVEFYISNEIKKFHHTQKNQLSYEGAFELINDTLILRHCKNFCGGFRILQISFCYEKQHLSDKAQRALT